MLQWGRALTRAEGDALYDPELARILASMGPRAHARGRLVLVGNRPRRLGALQWGRALTRGEGRAGARTAKARGGRLQWGRALTRAEGLSHSAGACLMSSLQWGRALTRAEGGL